MKRPQSIEELYKDRFDWVPDRLKKELGHFNVFTIADFVGRAAGPVPFSRRDYYKISLIMSSTRIDYADKTLYIEKQGLLFSNPQIPYSLERLDGQRTGYVCVFTGAFFHHFGNLNEYAAFQPGGTPVFELTDQHTAEVEAIFRRMLDEIGSDYRHKYDALRNLVFEILHSASRLEPSRSRPNNDTNASRRISLLFLELLERQFPIEDMRQRVVQRSASDFAGQLAIHVNYLNKAVRDTTGKTTTELIAERVLQEAKILLKSTSWNVSEIAYALGFREVTNFNNFFRKLAATNPTQFRNS